MGEYPVVQILCLPELPQQDACGLLRLQHQRKDFGANINMGAEMKCTYCDYLAFYRPKDLDDKRRACAYCVAKLPDSELFEFILPVDWPGWEVLQYR